MCDNEIEKKGQLPRAQAPQTGREMTCEDLTGRALTWGCSNNGGMLAVVHHGVGECVCIWFACPWWCSSTRSTSVRACIYIYIYIYIWISSLLDLIFLLATMTCLLGSKHFSFTYTCVFQGQNLNSSVVDIAQNGSRNLFSSNK